MLGVFQLMVGLAERVLANDMERANESKWVQELYLLSFGFKRIFRMDR
jgi:hypothetical protein